MVALRDVILAPIAECPCVCAVCFALRRAAESHARERWVYELERRVKQLEAERLGTGKTALNLLGAMHSTALARGQSSFEACVSLDSRG